MLTVSLVVFMLVFMVCSAVAAVSIVVMLSLFSVKSPKKRSGRTVVWETEVIESFEVERTEKRKILEIQTRQMEEAYKIGQCFCSIGVDYSHNYSEYCSCGDCRLIYWFEANQYIRVLEQQSLIVDSII